MPPAIKRHTAAATPTPMAIPDPVLSPLSWGALLLVVDANVAVPEGELLVEVGTNVGEEEDVLAVEVVDEAAHVWGCTFFALLMLNGGELELRPKSPLPDSWR